MQVSTPASSPGAVLGAPAPPGRRRWGKTALGTATALKERHRSGSTPRAVGCAGAAVTPDREARQGRAAVQGGEAGARRPLGNRGDPWGACAGRQPTAAGDLRQRDRPVASRTASRPADRDLLPGIAVARRFADTCGRQAGGAGPGWPVPPRHRTCGNADPVTVGMRSASHFRASDMTRSTRHEPPACPVQQRPGVPSPRPHDRDRAHRHGAGRVSPARGGQRTIAGAGVAGAAPRQARGRADATGDLKA